MTAAYLIVIGVMKFVGEGCGEIKITNWQITNWLMIATPILLGVLILSQGSQVGLYYPVAINLGLLLIFFASLLMPPSIVQRIAEKIEKRALDSVGIRYTAYVTRAWCVFFMVNGLISALLAWYQMMDLWTLYNGLIAYVLIGALLAGERVLRHRFQRKMQHQTD